MRGLGQKGRVDFLLGKKKKREKGRRREHSNLLFPIPRVSSIGIRRAMSESSTRTTHGCQKEGISLKFQRRRFQEIKDLGLGRPPTRATTLKDVGILPTFVADFYLSGCLAGFSALTGCLACFKMTLIVVLQLVCGWFCVLNCCCA